MTTTTNKNLLNDNEIDNLLNRLEIAAAFQSNDDDRSWMTDISDYQPTTKTTDDEPNWRMTLHG